MMKILFTIYAILIGLCGVFITVKQKLLKITPQQTSIYDLIIGIVIVITIGAIITENAWLEFFSLILGVFITFFINRLLIKSMKDK